MNEPIIKFKIKGLPTDKKYNLLPFGRQIEYRFALAAFKVGAKSIHLSQKRQTYTRAIREAIDLYDVDQYFCRFYCDINYKDDTFEFFYTKKAKRENVPATCDRATTA